MITQKISIAVPCYNEEKEAKNTYLKIKEQAEKLPEKNYEILFANDGSKDNTEKVLMEIAKKDKKFKPISYHPNRGMGYAWRQMFAAATGDIIIILDADLSTPASIIFPLIKTLNQENLDAVIASRYAGIYGKIPFSRDVGSWCYFFLNKLLFGFKIRDTQSGFVAFKADALKSLNLVSDRFEIHAELWSKFFKKRHKVKEIPAEYKARTEDSKFSVFTDAPKTVLKTFKVWWNLKFRGI